MVQIVIRIATTCSHASRFGGACSLYLHGRSKDDRMRFPETLVTAYKTARYRNLEDHEKPSQYFEFRLCHGTIVLSDSSISTITDKCLCHQSLLCEKLLHHMKIYLHCIRTLSICRRNQLLYSDVVSANIIGPTYMHNNTHTDMIIIRQLFL
jgi:hypothetical protein